LNLSSAKNDLTHNAQRIHALHRFVAYQTISVAYIAFHAEQLQGNGSRGSTTELHEDGADPYGA
jgi:hypothetical protein